MRPNKTFIPKVSDLKRSWYIIDAEGLVLGRLAAIVANKLRGKDKVFFTPNMQCGDNIIIVNSEKVLLKGQKRLRLTDGSEYVRLAGIVRPQDISASNTVSSNLIGGNFLLQASSPTFKISFTANRQLSQIPFGKMDSNWWNAGNFSVM